jgi:hypothetical protein
MKYTVAYIENDKPTVIGFNDLPSAMQYYWSCLELGLSAAIHDIADDERTNRLESADSYGTKPNN